MYLKFINVLPPSFFNQKTTIMANELIKKEGELIQRLVLDGDISRMSQEQKVLYYHQFCNSLGINPLTQPFQIIKFQGKERLYATKDCTEQLRKIHGVSITDISSTTVNDVFIVTAKAKDKDEKTDCSTGAVNIKGLSGDALANALMKAETKAKRRVTLSICGLGILDESETDTMPGAVTVDVAHEEVKPWLDEDHPAWQNVVTAIKGKYTVEQVKEKYNLSKRVETILYEIKETETV
jgi:hypothetical protein